MQIFCKFTKKIFVLFLTLFNILMVIVLSVGSTTDEHGHTRPVAFMPYRVNGQYIMEVAKKTTLQELKLISSHLRGWPAASCFHWVVPASW